MSRDAFVDACRSMVGVEWRHQGRKPWAVDCLGLVVLGLRAAGWPVVDRDGYARDPQNEGLRAELRRQAGEPVEWVHGGVALMKWPECHEPSHVGVLARVGDEWHLIHAYARGVGKVVEHRVDEYWRSMIVEVYDPWRGQ